MSVTRTPFPCACGCGELVEPSGRRRFASDACRQRGHRKRQVRARREVREAVAQRGDLESLLERAAQQARERPGSVVLRVDRRLRLLEAGELAALLSRRTSTAAPASAEQPDQASPMPASAELLALRRVVEQLARAIGDLTAWPRLDAGVYLVPEDTIVALQALAVEQLLGAA